MATIRLHCLPSPIHLLELGCQHRDITHYFLNRVAPLYAFAPSKHFVNKITPSTDSAPEWVTLHQFPSLCHLRPSSSCQSSSSRASSHSQSNRLQSWSSRSTTPPPILSHFDSDKHHSMYHYVSAMSCTLASGGSTM